MAEATNFILNVKGKQLPPECCDVYSRIPDMSGLGFWYCCFDEDYNAIFRITRDDSDSRWELWSNKTKECLAHNTSSANLVEDITTKWKVKNASRAQTFSFTEYLPDENRGRKRMRQEDDLEKNKEGRGGLKKRKRDFGNTFTQDNQQPIDPKHIPIVQIRATNILPDSPTPLQCDIDTKHDELYVGSYVEDIMAHYFESEDKYLAKSNYTESIQSEVTPAMREKMLDWVHMVATKFEQTDISFHLAVNIFDRYLSAKSIEKNRLQLVGSVCLWLASKYCEIRVAEMSDFVQHADNAFTDTQMLEVESDIVNVLDFDFTVPTSLNFAQRFAHVVKYFLETEKQKKRVVHLVNYYLECCLLIYELVGKKPSLIAAAATYAAAFWLDKSFIWGQEMKRVTGYDVEQFSEIVDVIKLEVYQKKRENARFVYTKYKEKAKECVAMMRYTGS